ncbi:hypothetical protein CHARACLAT_019610, partial [Characodon lateralis]|nr:hypothetical protein [Characodon lateralis]
ITKCGICGFDFLVMNTSVLLLLLYLLLCVYVCVRGCGDRQVSPDNWIAAVLPPDCCELLRRRISARSAVSYVWIPVALAGG